MLAALPEHHLFRAVSHNPFLMASGLMAERQMAGRIDGSTGRIDAADLDNPRADDVFDDLGALVERMGGEVHVLPAVRMPCRTGVGASFRH